MKITSVLAAGLIAACSIPATAQTFKSSAGEIAVATVVD